MTLKRCRAIFSGRVQGVGFRYRTVDLALDHPDLTGFVRNVPDGTVEVVAEAEEETLRRFFEELQNSSLKRWIFDTRLESSVIETRDHRGFRIHD